MIVAAKVQEIRKVKSSDCSVVFFARLARIVAAMTRLEIWIEIRILYLGIVTKLFAYGFQV